MEDIKVLSAKIRLEVVEETPSGGVVLAGDEPEPEADAITVGIILSPEAVQAVLGKLSDRPAGDLFDAKVFLLVGEKSALEAYGRNVVADRLSAGGL